MDELDSTTVPMYDSNKNYHEQEDHYFEKFLNWPHRNYKYIVIIMIPNPQKDQLGGKEYFNSIFNTLDDNQNNEKAGSDRKYIIPTEFIKGYLDVNKLEFIHNQNFNPPKRIEIKNVPLLTRKNISKTLDQDLPILPVLSENSNIGIW